MPREAQHTIRSSPPHLEPHERAESKGLNLLRKQEEEEPKM